MDLLSNTVGVVLAGGVGSRLAPLTANRAKPAVPFGGQYRIVDFTLSNCVNSGLRRVLVLTQYKSQSLQRHLINGWSIFNSQMGDYITAVPPQMRTGDSWYCGTADAVYQNLYLLERSNADYVAILSGDHIYRMDYSDMLRQHKATSADVTVACMEVPIADARSFGVMSLDSTQRIREFQEKPLRPKPIPQDPQRALASMGIYIFSADVLRRELVADHADPNSCHDFGKDILPRLIQTHQVFGYRFGDGQKNCDHRYWRDVGTIDAYFQANMELLDEAAPMNLYDRNWPIRTFTSPSPPAHIAIDPSAPHSGVRNSILCNGVVVAGGTVQQSIMSPGVRIAPGAIVSNAILFEDVVVEEGAVLKNCIIDKSVCVPRGTRVGTDRLQDAERFTVSDNGVVVVPRGYRFPQVRQLRRSVRPTQASQREYETEIVGLRQPIATAIPAAEPDAVGVS